MEELADELEPLFDYSRVQPLDIVCLDDDCSDSSPPFSPKRRKISDSAVEKVKGNNGKVREIIDSETKQEEEEEEEEDWLPPPPKVSSDRQKLVEDHTMKELRLKKQELVSFAQSAADVLRAVEESVKKEFSTSVQSSMENVADHPSKSSCERAKIIISIQDKDELKQFRVYMDDKFERLFKLYADKAKLDVQRLVFCFDGDKINPTATPNGLGMEDNDIVEVHVKSS